MVQIIRDVKSLREAVAALRRAGGPHGGRVALVPTMGALHAGHMALVKAAGGLADHVVTSIFVNPTQFGPNEDLSRYPRQEAADVALLEAEGCAIVWAPDAAAMYPDGHDTMIRVGKLATRWDGAARPGHFDGVATVVTKLFNQVQPDIALFGEKDWQQLAVIRRTVADLDMTIEIAGVPTERADDGLALSSRNAYLSAEERAAAPELHRAMQAAADAIRLGGNVPGALAAAEARIIAAGFGPVDYLALVDAETLEPMTSFSAPARMIAAAKLGTTRLIDNIAVE